MADIIYILNGREVSAKMLESLARAAGISVQEFKDKNNVTVKEATQVPDESKTVVENEGLFGDDFQEVTATEDVPAVTGIEDASKPIEEMPTSELELRLEETSLAIAEKEKELDDKGRYKQSNRPLITELNRLKIKKEKESTQLDVRYTNKERLDFNNALEPANQLEDRIVEEAKLEFPYLNIKTTGIGNEIVIKNYLDTGKDWNIKLDGSQEAIDAFKKLADDKKALQSGDTIDLTIDQSIQRIPETNDIESLNSLIKDGGYEVKREIKTPAYTVVESGSSKYGGGGSEVPATYFYQLYKDDKIVAYNINGFSRILKSDNKVKVAVETEAYDIQKQGLIANEKALEKQYNITRKNPDTELRYYQDGSFQKSIIKKIQDSGIEVTSAP